MKASRIEQKIDAKVKDWLKSIPEDMREYMYQNVVVTGGCITSMFLRERINDYDLYFKTQKAALMAAVYYAEHSSIAHDAQLRLTLTEPPKKAIELLYNKDVFQEKTSGGGWEKGRSWSPSEARIITDYDSSLVKTLLTETNNYIGKHLSRVEIFIKSAGHAAEVKNGQTPYATDDADDDFDDDEIEAMEARKSEEQVAAEKGREQQRYRAVFMSSNAITLSNKVQLVLRFVGAPEEIHKSYDFVHATNYWTAKQGLVTNKRALEAILARDLVYAGSLYPLASIFRTRKFIKRGWNMHIGNYVKMAMQLNQLDLNDVHVLEEQLTGVDAAYMMGLIRACQDLREREGEGVDYTNYVLALCDKMMGVRRNEEPSTDSVDEED